MPPEFWTAPRLWPGEPVVVAASGPSLTQADLDYVRGRARVIAVNDAYRLAPWTDALFAADARWWGLHLPALAGFAGLMVGCKDSVASERVRVIRHDASGEKHRFEDPRAVRGNNSGAEALHLAYHLAGAAPKILLGCDCTGTHFFGDHPKPLRQTGRPGAYAKGFEAVAKELARLGVPIANCSPISILRCFEKRALRDVI